MISFVRAISIRYLLLLGLVGVTVGELVMLSLDIDRICWTSRPFLRYHVDCEKVAEKYQELADNAAMGQDTNEALRPVVVMEARFGMGLAQSGSINRPCYWVKI
jgi:hypothetical protein